MSITLYTSSRCPWAARAYLALIEANLPYESIEIDLTVPREPWYLEQVNPLGKVPALKLPDGQVICESSVCAEYIADLSGKLLPKSPYERSIVRFFIEMFTSKFCPAISPQNASLPTADQLEKLYAAVKTVNDLLISYLKDGPFLLGSKDFTLAEIDCVPFLARFQLAGENGLLPLGSYEAIRSDTNLKCFNRYLDDCLSRPSHRQIWDQNVILDIMKVRFANAKPKKDFIFLQDLKLVGKVGLSAFSFPDRTFPICISLNVATKPVEDGSDIYSVSYGDVCREVTDIVAKGSFPRLEDLSAAIIKAPHVKNAWQTLIVEKEGGMLRADKEIFEIFPNGKARSSIIGMRIGCIIGIYSHERERKQDVLINMTMLRDKWAPNRSEEGCPIEVEEYKRTMIDAIAAYVEGSDFKTVEALAQAICELSLGVLPVTVDGVEVWISKPSALAFPKHSGVCVTRTRSEIVHT